MSDPLMPKRRLSRKPCPQSIAAAELAKVVAKLAREGRTAHEISKRCGLAKGSVYQIAKRRGIDLGAHRRRRRIVADLLDTQMPALDALAERAAVDRCEIISRLLAVALEDGGKPAVRLLGKLGQPKRRYLSQEERAARRAAEVAAKAAQEADRQAEAARRWAMAPEPVRAAVAAGQHPLRAVRLHLGLRQRDVAERAGLGFYGETRVGELERSGKPLTPRMRNRLAAATGIDPEWLASPLTSGPPASG